MAKIKHFDRSPRLFEETLVPARPGSDRLFDVTYEAASRPVICLGSEFANEDARRTQFTEELRKKLLDPEFRKIEGFPIGSDEDILNLSDPPYYTACPNPWIAEFIAQWESEKPKKPEGYQYHREPFAADVSEGKNDPIYNAHSYHTKVPHKAIMRYILHYTDPGDIVFDGFCGTGMTGVAAQLCGDRDVVMSLGYQVTSDGTILQEETDDNGSIAWKPFSKLGVRYACLNDLSPVATFIAHNYNSPFDIFDFEKNANRILDEFGKECGWMYETRHSDGSTICRFDYVAWSEIYSCPECDKEIVFLDVAMDKISKQVLKDFSCRHCDARITKQKMTRTFESFFDSRLQLTKRRPKRKPIEIMYRVGKTKKSKVPDEKDLAVLARVNQLDIPNSVPANEYPFDNMWDAPRLLSRDITHVQHLFLPRQLQSIAWLWEEIKKVPSLRTRSILFFWLDQSIAGLSILNRYSPTHFSQVNQQMSGVYYVPSQISECSPWYNLSGKLTRLTKAFKNTGKISGGYVIGTGSSTVLGTKANSVDYIFIDRPFGDNFAYAELNFLVESWLGVMTDMKPEAIVDRSKKNRAAQKGLQEYRQLITICFQEAYAALKPGRWLTIEFSNTKASVWNSIQNAIVEAGFIVANVSALDKQQGSFKAVTTPTAVKQDLVISAYKPNGGFEKRFLKEAQTEEGVWDFVRTHLKYLPVIKRQGTLLQFVPERDPRILFDQMVAYYVRKGFPVPLSSQEFQVGLAQRFIDRDGMFFLTDQAAEYDKKKAIAGELQAATLFVFDESSAILWLRQLLKQKPQTFADINPEFMQQLGGWSKNEAQLDLRELLNQNFLTYDGKTQVPEQIHAYLSSNWKELRNLDKDDPALVAKARDRWYVPDPNKAGDLEKLRERALLKEFDEYKQAKKKLKVFRIEAVRAGFKRAWQDRDYPTIVSVAEKIASNVLEEDPKLLMWYDQAVTRIGN